METITEQHICDCGARYITEVSTEFVAYSKTLTAGTEHRNADTISDGVGVVWRCPFCLRGEGRGDASGLL